MGPIKLNWSLSVPSGPNFFDTFGGARTSTGSAAASGTVTGSNIGATPENGEPLRRFVANAISTVWFKWAARSSGWVTFTTDGSLTPNGYSLDTVMGVYTGTSVGSLSAVAQDDDGGSGNTSSCRFYANKGMSYFICVGGYDGVVGTVKLTWSR